MHPGLELILNETHLSLGSRKGPFTEEVVPHTEIKSRSPFSPFVVREIWDGGRKKIYRGYLEKKDDIIKGKGDPVWRWYLYFRFWKLDCSKIVSKLKLCHLNFLLLLRESHLTTTAIREAQGFFVLFKPRRIVKQNLIYVHLFLQLHATFGLELVDSGGNNEILFSCQTSDDN